MASRHMHPVQKLFLLLRLIMVIFLLLFAGMHLLPLSKHVAIALLNRLWDALKFLAMTTAVSMVIFVTTAPSSSEYGPSDRKSGLWFERANSSMNSRYHSDYSSDGEVKITRRQESFVRKSYSYDDLNSADDREFIKSTGSAGKGISGTYSSDKQGEPVITHRSGKELSDFNNDMGKQSAINHRSDHLLDKTRHLSGNEIPDKYLADVESDSHQSSTSGLNKRTIKNIKNRRPRSRSRSRSVERRPLIPSLMVNNPDEASTSGSWKRPIRHEYQEYNGSSQSPHGTSHRSNHSSSDTSHNPDQSKADTSRSPGLGNRLSSSRSGRHINSMSAVDLTELVAIAEKTNCYNNTNGRHLPPKINIRPRHQKSQSYDLDRVRPPPPPFPAGNFDTGNASEAAEAPAMATSSDILSSRYNYPEEYGFKRTSSRRIRRSPLPNNNNSSATGYHSDSDDPNTVGSPSAEMINERASKFIDEFYHKLLEQRQNSIRERQQQQQQQQASAINTKNTINSNNR